ncbi:MAG: hypothetical protein ACJAQ3_002053 [Planctomycetota bacterium]|jgi:hypothetical protein
MTTHPPTDDLLRACAGLAESGTPSPELIQVTRPFIADVAETGTLQPSVLAALDHLPPHGAAWLAICLGSAVETGLDPAVAGGRLVELFRSWLARTSGGQEPELLEALPTLSQSLVAHLARLDELRSTLADDAEFTATLVARESDSHAITWIRELISRRSGDLYVVHAETQRVCHLRFSNVARCFHLFSLIQSVLGSALPGGRIPNEAVSLAARGTSDEPVTDQAWWHYQKGGAKPSMTNAIWGEESVEALRGPDGAYAVSLWDPLMGDRSWNSGFFGPALEAAPADLRFIAELQGPDAAAWAARVLA